MTYKELSKLISKMSPEEQSQDVTVFARNVDEYYAMDSLATTQVCDILDEGHKFIIV